MTFIFWYCFSMLHSVFKILFPFYNYGKSEVKLQFSLVAEPTPVSLPDLASGSLLYWYNICEIIPLPDHCNNLDKIQVPVVKCISILQCKFTFQNK